VALADHHQHLVSPAGAGWLNRAPVPVEQVPQAVENLLRERALRWNDKTTLAALYTEDSLVLSDLRPEWLRGRQAVADYLGTRFARPFRLTPIAYTEKGSTAHVAGYFTRGEGPDTKHIGSFTLTLVKGPDGQWRIAMESPIFPGPPAEGQISAEKLIAHLDTAGIRQAVVLSDAYWFDSTTEEANPDSYASVRAENDWTAQQVALFPERLIAFCSFNPLKPYALTELARCAADPRFKGVKLHFRSSGVDLKKPEHVEKVRQVFQAANVARLALIVHVRAGDHYEREHAEVLINQLLPAAPDVVVQIAHLWGGEGFSDSALAAYAEAVAAGHPATKRLYFDVSDAVLVAGGSADMLKTLAQRIRQIGVQRILYGSDAAMNRHPTPQEAWKAFRAEMPLTDEEFAAIAGNVAPYLRR
jgi:predicted TIM-barrel fold metal-dependent hydrolase